MAPLEHALTGLANSYGGNQYRKRIFLLTDGQVNNRNDCVHRARNAIDVATIHTFGISTECDEELV